MVLEKINISQFSYSQVGPRHISHVERESVCVRVCVDVSRDQRVAMRGRCQRQKMSKKACNNILMNGGSSKSKTHVLLLQTYLITTKRANAHAYLSHLNLLSPSFTKCDALGPTHVNYPTHIYYNPTNTWHKQPKLGTMQWKIYHSFSYSLTQKRRPCTQH